MKNDRLIEARMQKGWSQQEMARRIGTTHVNVSRWERGDTFPSHYYRHKLCELFEKNAEDLGLIHDHSLHIDWRQVPRVDQLYGREEECLKLQQWIVDDRCRLVALRGIAGIGKTSLAAKVTEQLRDKKGEFNYVFWRSLKDALPLKQFLQACLQFLSAQKADLPKDADEIFLLSLLIQYLRENRCLIVLDDMEVVLQADNQIGRHLESSEGYGELLLSVGQADHQSCLLLTSREQPKEAARLQGRLSPVRSLELQGVEQVAGKEILKDRDLFGSNEAWKDLVELYSGNPLALKLVAPSISDVFGGNIDEFLRQGEAVFGDIRDVLEEQFQLLSPLEQEIMYWLAIEREPISLDGLQEDLVLTVQRGELTEALSALRRRSMIEGDNRMGFGLNP